MKYKVAQVKFNGGDGALLCDGCDVIIAYGFEHEDRKHYCNECKDIKMEPVPGGGSYTPDNWVVLRLEQEEGPTIYRLLAGWSGGYAQSDYWQINSGIVRVEDHETYYSFFGNSGSEYRVWKDRYHVTIVMSEVVNTLGEYYSSVEGYELVMPEDTNWVEYNWIDK